MKQEIVKYLVSIEDEIYKLSKYLYDYPEDSFCENKAFNYLTKLLKDNNFDIEENLLDIPNAFKAQYGKGHPKIAYICEYDCSCKQGHILGTNLVSSMSIGAALGLSKEIEKVGGSVVIIGCPGESIGGSKVTMAKQGVFDDLDVVLMAQPSVITANCCSSPAILPLRIKYSCNKSYGCSGNSTYSSFDACLFTLNSMYTIIKGHSKDCSIDRISINGDLAPHIPANDIETSFSIKSPDLKIGEEIRQKLCTFTSNLNALMSIKAEVTLSGIPYENFTCNKTLCRIFSHNLKEAGVIDIGEDIHLPYGLSLGNVSKIVPCLKFLIKITEDDTIKYGSYDFGVATILPFARERVLDAIKVLIFTALDLIQKPDLLSEAKFELNNDKEKH